MARQRRVLERMIGLYCRGRHGSRMGEFCPRCEELYRYALRRLGGCPFGSEKPNCSSCRVHCYAPAMRERIREVMRYAGPRMLWCYPGDALAYLWRKVRIRPKDRPGR
ncbi:MAG TPA: nitrous oxide-stimulated promoter family protein [Candidatus Merdimorpha stercoravium]|uniref:Nitrous oxide-stimulated promoter family protein n=1 Tax=Candidatus Merdimorpha stercoravium TaxID=2840863 RepID=A0A9D1H9E4_9FLAO|nr:nitrous oxide-stimulated promoter family protein [Candidatus Merdimorpha stercoravium]